MTRKTNNDKTNMSIFTSERSTPLTSSVLFGVVLGGLGLLHMEMVVPGLTSTENAIQCEGEVDSELHVVQVVLSGVRQVREDVSRVYPDAVEGAKAKEGDDGTAERSEATHPRW